MLYELLEVKHGRKTVVMCDTIKNVRDRKKQLLDSQRKTKISYSIVKSGSNEKWMQKHKFRSH